MILRREHFDRSAPTSAPAPTATIGAWLDVLVALLRLPPAERGEIRDELESHLRDRVRDLMLAGHAEPHATTRAIAELGEAAQLAQRFYAARKRPFFRRHAMNLSILTLAGGAAIMSVVALSTATGLPANPARQGTAAPGAHAAPSQFAATQDGDPLAKATALAQLRNTTLERALASLAEAAAMPLIVRWGALDAIGIPRDHVIDLPIDKQLPLPTILHLLNESLDARERSRIEYRVSDGILEFAPREYFDRREVELISYDLAAVLAKDVALEHIVQLITALVERDNWVDNGGDLATAHALADRLFISAPPRMHERVSWILRQLEQPSARGETGILLDLVPRQTILDAVGSPINPHTAR